MSMQETPLSRSDMGQDSHVAQKKHGGSISSLLKPLVSPETMWSSSLSTVSLCSQAASHLACPCLTREHPSRVVLLRLTLTSHRRGWHTPTVHTNYAHHDIHLVRQVPKEGHPSSSAQGGAKLVPPLSSLSSVCCPILARPRLRSLVGSYQYVRLTSNLAACSPDASAQAQ